MSTPRTTRSLCRALVLAGACTPLACDADHTPEDCSDRRTTDACQPDASARTDAAPTTDAGRTMDAGADAADMGQPEDSGVAESDAGSTMDSDVTTEPRPFHIRFATYNVRTSNLNNSAWGDHHRGWDRNDGDRMRRIADVIASQNLHVVSLQEARRPEREAILRRLTNEHGQDWGRTARRRGADDTIVIFRRDKWRKIRVTRYKIPMQNDLRDRYQIGALLHHRPTDRRVWFYSVHFAAGRDAWRQRREAARRTVHSIRNRAVDNGKPFVLGGDFNTTGGSPVGDIMLSSGFMKYTRRVADRRVGNGCKTFNGRAGSEGLQACPGGWAKHIDLVYVPKRSMKVLKYKVTATARTSRASDHNPVTTILRKR